MKKIVVTSDSHSRVNKLYNIFKKHRHADLFIHLGDYISDAEKASKNLGINVVCIKANGDIGSVLPLSREIIVEKHKILAVHGHLERVKYSLIRLSLAAREAGADIVLFGHTHIPMVENNGVLFVNPGHAYSGQYATITIDNGVANAKLLKL